MTTANAEAPYFHGVGRTLCLVGAALGVGAVACTLLLGGFWMMTLLGAPPLLAMGGAMMLAPGPVRRAEGLRGELAWTASPARVRLAWLGALIVGIALGLALWGLLVPHVTLHG